MLAAHFENGTPGVQIYNTDLGGPDAFDVVVQSPTTTLYDKTHARGVLAAKFRTESSGDDVALCRWSTSYVAGAASLTDAYHRLYVYLSANPVDASAICASDVSGNIGARVRIHADRKLRLTDAAGTVQATAVNALPTGQWVRLDWHLVNDTSAGSSTLRVFTSDPEAAVGSPDETITATSINTGAAATGFRFGWLLGNVSQPDIWIDAVAAGAGAWVGPSLSEPNRDVPFDAFVAAVAGNATTATLADYTNKLTEANDRLQFVSTPTYGSSGLVLRCEIHQDDHNHNGVNERTEFTAPGITYTPGQDFWIASAIRLDPTFPSVMDPLWQLLWQFFGETGGSSTGSPPLALEISNDVLRLTVRGGVKAVSTDDAPREIGHNIAPATKDVWHELLVHPVFSTGSDGSVEVFHRERGGTFPRVPQVTDNGMNVLTVGGAEQWLYPEFGQYRATRPEIGIAYYGAVRIRSTRADAEAVFPTTAGWRPRGLLVA